MNCGEYNIPLPDEHYELGDWVQVKTGLYGEQRTPPMYVVAVFGDCVYTEMDAEQGDPFEYGMDVVVPISLTKEIVDANTLSSITERGTKMALYMEDGAWTIAIHSKTGEMTKRINYVHQIQHILRLFGVHKQILL